MFWLTRPPYLRWAAACLVVVVATWIEFRPDASTPHPFAVAPIGVGELVDASVVEWRDVPVGLLAPVTLPLTSDRAVAPGEPILAPSATPDTGVPTGWWALELDLPAGARPGDPVRIVAHTGVNRGVVVEVRDGDFGERTGLVAVPEDAADAVATAAADHGLVVMVGG